MNGSVGCVKNIVYRSPTGPWVSGAFLAYVVFDFLKFFIKEDHKLLPGKPRT